MKYLIGENLKVKWKGEFVNADEDKGEFIFDTDENELTKATLVGMAEANEVSIGKKDNVATLVDKLHQSFETLELKEVSVMSDEKKVEEIVVAGVEAGKSDDDMLVEVVNSGVSFKKAIKLFKNVMETKGLRISAKKRADKIAELIAELNFQPETGDDVQSMITKITKEVPDTNEKQAIGALRRWAKKAEYDLPKVKKSGAAAGGVRGKIYAFMIDHPKATPEQFTAWVTASTDDDGLGKDEKTAKRFLPVFEVARKMAEAIIKMDAEDEAEAA